MKRKQSVTAMEIIGSAFSVVLATYFREYSYKHYNTDTYWLILVAI